jgi:hypothetical protein
MAKPTKFLALLLAEWSPEEYVVAVIDDLSEAETARTALHLADFGAGEMRLFRGALAAEKLDETEKQRTLLERATVSVRGVVSDECIISEDYEAEARADHQILVVETRQPEQVEQAYRILRAHHGHSIEHFGRWVITDLWQEDTSHP